ncbi:MAG TPA: M20/M25/M40 family metallo-hydrolase [Gemmatimonadaceae bacterium]|nr:M20/M25/M40 family metallo-hydrolase [Gemmatimonadaceae bacterium]
MRLGWLAERAALPVVMAALLAAPGVDAQARGVAGGARERIEAWRATHEGAIVRELSDFLALPNVASDTLAIRRNAEHLMAMMRRRGIRTRLLEAPGSLPAVYGELPAPNARRTIVLYAHYDGQPVDTARWATSPWQPTLRDAPLEAGGKVLPLPAAPDARLDGEWRLYARSASDDKAPIVVMLAALDALRASGLAPDVNLKFFFEGGEEAGSPNLRALLERHAETLKADAWIFCDGPVHQTRRQQVVYGVRGTYGLEMTVYGPKRALHSGHYGNWAPNPAALLVTLLASMRDDDGRILIPGWYDDVRPVSAAERRAISAMPAIDDALRRDLALGATEAGDAPLAERLMLPALNIRGIEVGRTGALASNVISQTARASIDFRLVPDETPARARELVERHVRTRGWHIVHEEPNDSVRRAHPRVVRLEWDEGGYPAMRTDMALPVARAVARAVEQGAGAPPVLVPMLGGSLPMAVFAEVLRVPLIIVPIVNHDNNQHAANENLRLRNLWDGIAVLGTMMSRLGEEW